VLRRKDKRRYILVYVNDQIFTDSSQLMNDSTDTFYYTTNSKICNNNIPYFIKIIKKRFYELFGSIEFEKASINIVYEQHLFLRNCFILRCNIKSLDKVLFVLSCCHPPLTTIKISGTLKKLISSIEILKT
jgi:RNase P/RNase MRP subunit POP5